MQKFIGVKLVEAVEGASLVPSGKYEKGSAGYMVTYPDGYTSWCPKEVFEKYNLPVVGEKNKVDITDVYEMIADTAVATLTPDGSKSKTTAVVCTLINGFTITETSACVDPDNYDEEVGRDICMSKIIDKIWFLLGFLLQSAVYGFKQSEV